MAVLALDQLKDNKKLKTNPTKTPPEVQLDDHQDIKDKALWLKGKRGKGKGTSKGKYRQWDIWTQSDMDESSQWSMPSPKGKGREKGRTNMVHGNGFDSQPLWCDIHQRYGHSTDWCYENPHRTGGKTPSSDGFWNEPWCETCNRSGHTANNCYATTIRLSPKGKGTPNGKGVTPSQSGHGGKGKYGNRSWKSPNFPAASQSEQATPALHDETPSSTDNAWWESHELGSVVLERIQPTFFLDDADDDEVATYIDLIIQTILNNMERKHAYREAPSAQLQQEITEHSQLIAQAENCTNLHIQRIIRNFRQSIKYDDMDSEHEIDLQHDAHLWIDSSTELDESPTATESKFEMPIAESQLRSEGASEREE
jgi:hypothetical protein